MYSTNSYDLAEVYFVTDYQKDKTYLIGNKQDFIKYLASNFSYDLFGKVQFTFFANFILNEHDVVEYNKRWYFYDGFYRSINPLDYKDEVIKYFYAFIYQKYHFYKPVAVFKYRNGPVEGIHSLKWRKNEPHCHYKQRAILATDPEYKEYKRGDKNDYHFYHYHKGELRNWKKYRKTQYKAI